MKKYEKIKVPFWLTDELLVRDIETSDCFPFNFGIISETPKSDWVNFHFEHDDFDKDFSFNVYRHDLIVFAKKVKSLLEAKSLADIHKFYLALDEESIIIGWRPDLLRFAEAIEEFEKELKELEDRRKGSDQQDNQHKD